MQASRLLSILMLLQARGRMTASQLAAELEVTTRTILRDIDQLSAAGVPLWGARGRAGGFQLRDGWSTKLTGLTETEVQALFLAGLPAAATELGLGGAAASARLKVIASLPAPWREQATVVAARFHVDPVDWYQERETPRFLREVAQAVWTGQRIEVSYQSWTRATRCELEPLGLVLKAGTWYMAARRRGRTAVGTYRIANVLSLSVSGTRFKWPRRFDLASYWRDSTVRFEAELHRGQAHVRASPKALSWLVNERAKFTRLNAKGESPQRRNWHDVLVGIESIEHGARRLLSFGAEIEVIAPEDLRQAVASLITSLGYVYRR